MKCHTFYSVSFSIYTSCFTKIHCHQLTSSQFSFPLSWTSMILMIEGLLVCLNVGRTLLLLSSRSGLWLSASTLVVVLLPWTFVALFLCFLAEECWTTVPMQVMPPLLLQGCFGLECWWTGRVHRLTLGSAPRFDCCLHLYHFYVMVACP